MPISSDEATHQKLKRCVFAYVDERKTDGWSPERVIIAIRQIAREAGLKPSPIVSDPKRKITSHDILLVELVGWCINRYFATDRY